MNQMLKIILYSVILITLIILVLYVSRSLIDSITISKKISETNGDYQNLISSVIGLITVIVLCLTLFLQKKQHNETIEEQRKQYESQIGILQKEHAFNYIDALFEKFEKNLVTNTDSIQHINENIIHRCQEYLKTLEKRNSGNKEAIEEAAMSHSNEFWTEAEIEAEIESLYRFISRYEFLEDEIKKQEHLNDEIKSVYIENLKHVYKYLSFKKAIDFVYKNKNNLQYVIEIFNRYNINRQTFY